MNAGEHSHLKNTTLVLEFADSLQSEPESEYVPQTPLAKKLWEIRTRAIASGMQLLNEAEIEQEIAERRGGYLNSDLAPTPGE